MRRLCDNRNGCKGHQQRNDQPSEGKSITEHCQLLFTGTSVLAGILFLISKTAPWYTRLACPRHRKTIFHREHSRRSAIRRVAGCPAQASSLLLGWGC